MTRVLLLSLCLVLAAGCELSAQDGSPQTEIATALIDATPTTTPTLIATRTGVTPGPTPILTRQPGLLISGYVHLTDGSGLADVEIYQAFAAYPGRLLATTDQDGYYAADFLHIPGDEMVRVWAELVGYIIEPADEAFSWEPGLYVWRHYYGCEKATLDFVARPAP